MICWLNKLSVDLISYLAGRKIRHSEGGHEFFFYRFFAGIAAPCFAYRRTFTSCFRTLLCALQRVEITTPLAPRMDLVDINCSTFPFDIPALDTFVNWTLNGFAFQHWTLFVNWILNGFAFQHWTLLWTEHWTILHFSNAYIWTLMSIRFPSLRGTARWIVLNYLNILFAKTFCYWRFCLPFWTTAFCFSHRTLQPPASPAPPCKS